jgi:hypothetical protein
MQALPPGSLRPPFRKLRPAYLPPPRDSRLRQSNATAAKGLPLWRSSYVPAMAPLTSRLMRKPCLRMRRPRVQSRS